MAYQFKNIDGKRDSLTFDSCHNLAEKWEASDRRNRTVIVNLIDLLVSKGLITEAEVINDLFEVRDDFEVAPDA